MCNCVGCSRMQTLIRAFKNAPTVFRAALGQKFVIAPAFFTGMQPLILAQKKAPAAFT